MIKKFSFFSLGLLFVACTLPRPHVRRSVQHYRDTFSVNNLSSKPYPSKKKIDPEFKKNLASFLADAKRYGRLEMAKPERLRVFGFKKRNFVNKEEGYMIAACLIQRNLSPDPSSPGLGKPGKPWLEIEVNQKAYKSFVAKSPRRAKYVIYHILFHCFYQEGHLPSGHIGIMEDNFYDPEMTTHQKTDEQLVRELFTDKSFDILPDTR